MKSNLYKTRKRLIILLLVLVTTSFIFSGNYESINSIDHLPKKSDTDKFKIEWSRLRIRGKGCYDTALGRYEDIYMVGEDEYYNGYVVKWDKNADLKWEISDSEARFRAIARDPSDYLYCAGHGWNPSNPFDEDIFLLRYDSNGVLLNKQLFNKRQNDIAYSVVVDGSNNVYVVGITYDEGGNQDIILVKFNSYGNYLWDRVLDVRDEDVGTGLAIDSSNNVYLSGYHRASSSSNDIIIAKYNPQGTLQWSKTWGVSNQNEEAHDIQLDSSGNIYISGYTSDGTSALLIKFNNAGNEIWNRKWNGGVEEKGLSLDLDSSGNIYISGSVESYTSSGTLFLVYKTDGTFQWSWSQGSTNSFAGKSISVAGSKNVYIGGAYRSSGDYFFYLIKFNPTPIININTPGPNDLFSFNPPNFNVDISDNDLISKYYKINDGPSYVFTDSTGTIDLDAWNTCGNGTVSIKFYANDKVGASFEEVIVRKDILAPDFEIITPTTYQVCTDTAPNYQLTTSDIDVNAIWYTLNGGGNIIASSLTGIIDQNAWDTLDNGSVLIEFFLEDDIGNIASKSVEVYKNYEIPLIYIISPLPNQFCGLISPNYSISTDSLWSIDEMWYSLNSGQNITITEIDGTIEQTEWDLSDNETVTITFYANNSLGNVGNAEVTVRKDIYFPFIDIYAPKASQKYGISPPNYNVSITSVSLDYKWYSLNFGADIHFLDDVGIIDKSAWNACGNGTVVITFYANNTGGIGNSKEISIYKDVRRPNITIISPSTEVLYGLETIGFSISIDEPQLEKTWYSLNGGTNYSFVGMSGIIDQAAWDSCGNGTVTISFYANNTVGNIAIAELIVHKDVYYPFITIISPESEQWCGINAPNYNFSVSSLDVDSMWYSLNDGINFSIFTTIGTIDQLYWDNYGNENVTITFYANNSYGQLNFESVKIKKNITIPSITIFSPQAFELFGIETIDFNVSITDPTLDSTWFTLNGGAKYFFTNNYGIIDQTAWDTCGNGTVTITFFANNSLGNIGYAEVTVYKDIYYPFMEIHAPINNQLVGPLAPRFNITVSSYAIDSMWYVLNYSTIGFILEPEGMIDQSKWDLFGAGFITITFYTNNTYGQINFKEVLVTKRMDTIPRNAYAIVIGISDYPGTGSDLNYCDDDADDVYSMLINDYNFLPENIILLKDASATKSGIDNAFANINSKINPDDIFYFFYSGHGGSEITTSTSTFYLNSPHPYPNYYDRTWYISASDAAYIRVHFSDFDLEYGYDYLYIGDAMITEGYAYQSLTGYDTNFWSNWIPVLNDNRIYLRMITDWYHSGDYGFRIDQIETMRYSNPHYMCPHDSIPSNPSRYYLDILLDSKLDSLNCNNIYTIVDACNSGGLIPEAQDTGRLIMTACGDGQVSYEDSYLQQGVFTHYLLNSLNNANDQNSDGVISLEECFSYISSGTRSYTAGYGPGYQCNPQLSDGIAGQAVLYPSIGSVYTNRVDNKLYYSFYLYGHGTLKTLNLTVCSLSPSITFKTEEIKYQLVSPTGFGYYSGVIELEEGYVAGGIQLLAEVEGYGLITINLRHGDSDGDGLTDFFEIFDGNGLDPTNNDTDGDGLLDGEELNTYNTDPLNADSDSDGLLDGEEVNKYSTNPLNADSDSDGLLDGEEVNTYGTNPLLVDSDADGLSDYDEIIVHYTDPMNPDTDSDSITDGDEINIYLTDPFNNDTDSDGLLDGEEVYLHFTDPLLEDTDSDGLNDYDEINIYNTDPLDADTDSDTMPDGWEIFNLLDPLINDTVLDPDNDTLTNILEYQFNTNPFNNDTDSDGLLDGEEVHLYGTNPALNDTDSDGLSDYDELMIYFTDPLQADSDAY